VSGTGATVVGLAWRPPLSPQAAMAAMGNTVSAANVVKDRKLPISSP
jgi:hypothetical protein